MIVGGIATFSKQAESSIWMGVDYILIDAASVLGQVAFFLVVDLMLPLLDKQKDQQTQMKKYIFGSYETSDELTDAVRAQNPFLQYA